ncbi:carbohydrate ABC transporter permease [Nocardioides bruguierae]|uniref:Sugar ABC transporter permease n=1 Tax=Nocardioides bruguierae TaxID=2945102 RepID=A0A9X2D7M7_9ACTN|nr:sugar ABC transporter permease [Nocardioides bruguierae]MCL8025503.1 sugar ABC transporter permease [Nocardioides bruguierae]MCL8027390.1 sugar ABC transporter permease [Nocardioides bruguierae]MCM0620660.1 sugar ABC transporter permease [Nocardioides bruguierae]
MTSTLDREVEPTPDQPPAPPARQLSSRERWTRRGPLMPALIFTIVVTQLPFLLTIAISTLNWNVLRPGDKNFLGMGNFESFAGLGNYATVFTDSRLRDAVINTIVLTVSVVVVSMLLGLLLAVLLDRKFPGRGVARTLLIAPFLVMPVASALIWKHALYNPDYGLFNGVLNWVWQLFGAEEGPVIDYVSGTPMIAVVAALVWQWTPFMMLILLAGLQSQPTDVLEAARLDRASGMQIFRFITLPHLRRYIELSTLLGSIYVLQTFDAIFTITQGGPGSATTNLPYEIYLTMFRKYEYGEAAAAGVVVVIGTIIVATFALRTISSLFTEEHSR